MLPVIDSTNQYLLDRLDELKSGDACVAEYQQAGRGRRGRKWFSPFGANLYLHVLASGTRPAAAIGLSTVIGIVIAEVLQSLGRITFGSNGRMIFICRTASCPVSGRTDRQNR